MRRAVLPDMDDLDARLSAPSPLYMLYQIEWRIEHVMAALGDNAPARERASQAAALVKLLIQAQGGRA